MIEREPNWSPDLDPPETYVWPDEAECAECHAIVGAGFIFCDACRVREDIHEEERRAP